jgi:hypothetical protein
MIEKKERGAISCLVELEDIMLIYFLMEEI